MIAHTVHGGRLLVDDEYELCSVLVDQYGTHWVKGSDGVFRRTRVAMATLDAAGERLVRIAILPKEKA